MTSRRNLKFFIYFFIVTIRVEVNVHDLEQKEEKCHHQHQKKIQCNMNESNLFLNAFTQTACTTSLGNVLNTRLGIKCCLEVLRKHSFRSLS